MTELGSSDAALHGIVERSCCGDIVEAATCLLAGPHIIESGLNRAKPRRLLAQYGVHDSTHRRTCVGWELDANHVCGVQQLR